MFCIASAPRWCIDGQVVNHKVAYDSREAHDEKLSKEEQHVRNEIDHANLGGILEDESKGFACALAKVLSRNARHDVCIFADELDKLFEQTIAEHEACLDRSRYLVVAWQAIGHALQPKEEEFQDEAHSDEE